MPNSSDIRLLFDKRAVLIDDQLDSKRYLVLSDLHIGFEEKFKLSGVQLQPSITNLVQEVTDMIEAHKITDLILNGDIKSSITRISRSEWEMVPRFFNRIPKECRISVITGNHDIGLKELIPETVEIVDSDGLLINSNLVMHGHTRPLSKFSGVADRIIMGHVHPIFQSRGNPISGQPMWVILKTVKSSVFQIDSISDQGEMEIILMPSFNLDLVVAGYAEEAAREERKNAPILRQLESIHEARILTLQGDLIGDSTNLFRVI